MTRPVGLKSSSLLSFPDDTSAYNFALSQGWIEQGMWYYNTTTKGFRYYNGSTWQSAASWDEQNILYVGKHGVDTNNGLSIPESYLTINAAITEAIAQGVGPANPYIVRIMDAGIYTEDLILPSHLIIIGEAATIIGNHFVNDDSGISVLGFIDNSGICISKNAGIGTAIITANHMSLTTNGIGFFCDSGDLEVNISTVNIVNGFGVGSLSSEELSLKITNIHITGTGVGIACGGTGRIEIISNHLYCNGNGTAFLILAGTTGYISALVNDIDTNVNWNINGGTLRLKANRIGPSVGGNTEIGSVWINDSYYASDIDNVLRTIIPNAPGDVTSALIYDGLIIESAGGVSSVAGNLTPGSGVNLYNDGVDVLSLVVWADGRVTIQRTAGAATFDVQLEMKWR